MPLWYKLIRPAIFLCRPEPAHAVASAAIKIASRFTVKGFNPPCLESKLFNTTLPSPIGLAAGYDKKGDMVNALPSLGYAYGELGTFTKSYQSGNTGVRIHRLVREQALFNRMGFNNPGIEAGLENIALSKPRLPFALSIGKSKDTQPQNATDDYLEILEKIHNHAYLFSRILYIAINISSPNTPGLRNLQDKNLLKNLLTKIRAATDLSLVVKFSPDFESKKQFQEAAETALKSGINGFVVTNTTTDFSLVNNLPRHLAKLGGGISGKPLKNKAMNYLDDLLEVTKGRVPIISSGAVMSPQDVWQRLLKGADLVQLYTGMIYYGPTLAGDSKRYIVQKMRQNGISNLEEVKNYRNDLTI